MSQTDLVAPHTVAPAAQPTPMQLIAQAALNPDFPMERMQQLFELQLRWEQNEARKAYEQAFAAFKAEAVVVLRNVDIKDGPLKGKKHADLYGAVSVAVPYLSKHGLSHRWKLTRDEPNWMEVTCFLTHVGGHSETKSMGGEPDKGPGRNAIQARASTLSYLERYTFMGVCGLAVKGMDDDANGGDKDKPRLSIEDFDQRISLICDAPTVSDLQKVYLPANRAALAIGDNDSARAFTNAKNKRYRELVPLEESK